MTTVEAAYINLPTRICDLIEIVQPIAIQNEKQLDFMIDMVDSLMALRKFTNEQAAYLETLVQLIEAYEAKRHAIETDDLSGNDRYL